MCSVILFIELAKILIIRLKSTFFLSLKVYFNITRFFSGQFIKSLSTLWPAATQYLKRNGVIKWPVKLEGRPVVDSISLIFGR